MLEELNNQDLIFLTVGPILGLFLLICLIYIIYTYCFKKPLREDELSIIEGNHDDRYEMSLGNLRLPTDLNLVQKVNQEIRHQIRKSRESAYVYLQFFIRSNPNEKFVSIEHLYNIGSQSEVERNWFLVKQAIKRDNTQANKFKI
ncbi:hypothetical protein BpHYR1_048121 [Brachionus plicatilis]|uniref:Uncharacterized protein n=1 Tax=Brachionus plicatilis TaxID=10195 RepID=A0A3M7Q8K6_BRAPC|nr:hypothetical protein BpHYR1_048121 [Brachionus plicatilis]